jgi:hypothetical protein
VGSLSAIACQDLLFPGTSLPPMVRTSTINIHKKRVNPKSKGLRGRIPNLYPKFSLGIFGYKPNLNRRFLWVFLGSNPILFGFQGSLYLAPRTPNPSVRGDLDMGTLLRTAAKGRRKMRKNQKEVHHVHWTFCFMSLGGELVVFPHVHEVHHVHQVHWKRLNLAAISCEENAASQRLQSSKSLIFKEQEFPLPPRRSLSFKNGCNAFVNLGWREKSTTFLPFFRS